MKNTVFVVMGKSGSGKDSVVKYLLDINHSLKKLTPITTRPIRKGEQNNVEYAFTNRKKFEKMIDDGLIMEHRKYNVKIANGSDDIWFYGHMKPTDKYTILIGTLEVYENLKDNEEFNVVPIYIDINKEERLYRTILRENLNDEKNYRELCRRFFQDEIDFSHDKLLSLGVTHIFINKDIMITANDINYYIIKNYMSTGGYDYE